MHQDSLCKFVFFTNTLSIPYANYPNFSYFPCFPLADPKAKKKRIGQFSADTFFTSLIIFFQAITFLPNLFFPDGIPS